MDISFEKVDKVSALLTIKLEKVDYAGLVEKSLKDYRKKTNMPGFRPGAVPIGLLKKRFGREITAEEVNKLLGEKLYGYIQENNIEILGEPLPSESHQYPIDFDTMEDFTFAFDIALAPQFDATLSASDTIDYYDVEPDDKLVDEQVKMYAGRFGSYGTAEKYEDGDMLKGRLFEADADGALLEGGIDVEHAVLMPKYMQNEEQKKLFDGCAVGGKVGFNPYKAYEGRSAELKSLLKIEQDEVEKHKSDFCYEVEEISRFKPAEINQELFDKASGEGVCDGEQAFRDKIKSDLKGQFSAQSDYKFAQDVRAYTFSRIGKLDYADEILKRFMKLRNRDKDEKNIEENYDKSIEELTWHLIKEQLVKAYELKIEQSDLLETAKTLTKMQFAQYGMSNVPEDLLNKYAEGMLKEKDKVDALVDRSIENKLVAKLKEVVTLNRKVVGPEEFGKALA